MQDNKIKYKYVEKVNFNQVNNIEKHFNVLLPEDYKVSLSLLNRGKPIKDQIDIFNRSGCVIDYFVDLNLVINIADNIKQKNFIAFASDPFGNYFGFLIKGNENVHDIYFWDHETGSLVKVTNSFSLFINSLY